MRSAPKWSKLCLIWIPMFIGSTSFAEQDSRAMRDKEARKKRQTEMQSKREQRLQDVFNGNLQGPRWEQRRQSDWVKGSVADKNDLNSRRIKTRATHSSKSASENWRERSKSKLDARRERAAEVATKQAAKKRSRTSPTRVAKVQKAIAFTCEPTSIATVSQCLNRSGKRGVQFPAFARGVRKASETVQNQLRVALENSAAAPSYQERLLAVRSLGELGLSASWEVVKGILSSSSSAKGSADQDYQSDLKAAAAVSLGQIARNSSKRTETVSILKAVVKAKDSSQQVVEGAVVGLGYVTSAHSVRALAAILSETEASSSLQKAASISLARAGAGIEDPAEYQEAKKDLMITYRAMGPAGSSHDLAIARQANRLGKKSLRDLSLMVYMHFTNPSQVTLPDDVRKELIESGIPQIAINAYSDKEDDSDYELRVDVTNMLGASLVLTDRPSEMKRLVQTLTYVIPRSSDESFMNGLIKGLGKNDHGVLVVLAAAEKFDVTGMSYLSEKELFAKVNDLQKNAKRDSLNLDAWVLDMSGKLSSFETETAAAEWLTLLRWTKESEAQLQVLSAALSDSRGSATASADIRSGLEQWAKSVDSSVKDRAEQLQSAWGHSGQ